jgi:HlyD family secretion protein
MDVHASFRREFAGKVGQHNDMRVQIVGALTPGERIVLHPNDRIVDGTRIVPRSAT